MDTTWRVGRDAIRTHTILLTVEDIAGACLTVVAVVLFGWLALAVMVALGLLRVGQLRFSRRRFPRRHAALQALQNGIQGQLPETSAWWLLAAAVGVLGLPVQASKALLFSWGAPDLSTWLAPLHCRLVGSCVYVYDDRAVADGVELWQLGCQPIRADALHRLAHQRGIILMPDDRRPGAGAPVAE